MPTIAIDSHTQQSERIQAKFWIVLVGINHYQDRQIADLSYCANDCRELAAALTTATQQFQETEIISLYDRAQQPPNLLEITTSIQQFRLAKPEDIVLFYFSGHGYLDSNNRPVLCVADTNIDDLAGTGLKLDTLLTELRQCQAKRQLIWLDACQEPEEQQDRQIRQNPTSQLLAVLERQSEQSQDFYAMLSCDRTERSWEISELKHGLFTYFLIEGLKGKAANLQGEIDAESLFRYVERSSQKFIEYKKNFVDRDDIFKGMGIPLRASSSQPIINRFPANAAQTPQRIARGSGELIVGSSTPLTQRMALIVDRLSASKTDLHFCRLLQSRGSFEVEYFFGTDKQGRSLQTIIASYLQAENPNTLLLYLAGAIESTDSETYNLVCAEDNRINLNWLSQQLRDAPVREVIIIADILDTSGTTKSLVEILNPSRDKSLCLITATSSSKNSDKLLDRVVNILAAAGKSEREFWAAELITKLQTGKDLQSEIDIKWWLSGSTEVMEILSVAVQRTANEIFEIDICPYQSLKAFTQDDAYFFHGREDLIVEIIEKLQSTFFLTVVGASGSGKSSVVRAGVVPQLVTNGLFDAELARDRSCQAWVMLPGDSPLATLAATLAPDRPDFLEGVLHLGIDSFIAWLQQQPQLISVLVIDQFEELFTLTAETDRVNFLNLILGAIATARDYFRVIITLRSDFLDECLEMSELAPLMAKSQVLVPSCRLEDKQYRQMIVQPAAKVGLEVEDALTEVLLAELKEGSLPLLQYALAELWQQRSPGKLTAKDYRQYIGQLGKFLSNKAQETYDRLTEAEQQCAQSIFLSLVFLVKEQKDTRRRLPISDLSLDKHKDVLDSTLQALIDARLIVIGGEESDLALVKKDLVNRDDRWTKNLAGSASSAGEINSIQNKDKVTVEVAHEILLRDWETLKWWLDENREKYRLIKEINQDTDKWLQNEKRDDFLLSKGALAKYEEFYVKYANDLSGNSHEFIDASIQARDKDAKLAKRRQRQIIGGLIGGILALSTIAGVAIWQLHRATINEVNTLSNSTEALLASNQELDALVAGLKAGKIIKNINFAVDDQTRTKLILRINEIFSRVREVNRLEGDNRYFPEIFFKSGYQFIISFDEQSKTLMKWSLEGKLVKVTKNNSFKLEDLVFSIDGQIIAFSSSANNTVELWNWEGKLIKTLEKGSRMIDFSPDSKSIVFSSEGGKIKIWNIQDRVLYPLKDTSKVDSIAQIKFSPDSKSLISLSSHQGQGVKLWDMRGKLLSTLKVDIDVNASGNFIKFSPNSQSVAFLARNGTFIVWNIYQVSAYPLICNQREVTFSPDSQRYACISGNEIKVGNLNNNLIINSTKIDGLLQRLQFSPDSRKLVFTRSYFSKQTFFLWNLQDKLPQEIGAHSENIDSTGTNSPNIQFSPNSQIIASASKNTIKLWDLKGKLIQNINGHAAPIKSLKFSYNGQFMASYSEDKTVKIWNLNNNLIPAFNVSNARFNNSRPIDFSPDGNFFVSYEKDKVVKLWNLQGQLVRSLKNTSQLIFSPDSRAVVSVNSDSSEIKLWDLKGKLISSTQTPIGSDQGNDGVDFSPDGKIIAFPVGRTFEFWNLKGQQIYSINDVASIRFSPDNEVIAALGWEKWLPLKIWNIKTRKLIHSFEFGSRNYQATKFSPDGSIFAFSTIGDDNKDKIMLWSMKNKSLNSIDKVNGINIGNIEFSPDSQILASIGDNILEVWDSNRNLIFSLPGAKNIFFSRNSKIIVTITDDNKIKVLNRKGDLIHTLKGYTGKVNSVIFSPDDRMIASASDDGTIKLWSLDLEDVMTRGCDWVRDYLAYNPKVSAEDREICDGIGSK
jgi:WD40 repeat protein